MEYTYGLRVICKSLICQRGIRQEIVYCNVTFLRLFSQRLVGESGLKRNHAIFGQILTTADVQWMPIVEEIMTRFILLPNRSRFTKQTAVVVVKITPGNFAKRQSQIAGRGRAARGSESNLIGVVRSDNSPTCVRSLITVQRSAWKAQTGNRPEIDESRFLWNNYQL